MVGRGGAAICDRCGSAYAHGCMIEFPSICPDCREICDGCGGSGKKLKECHQCFGIWHECAICGWKGSRDPLASDADYEEFLRVHPLTPEEKHMIQHSVTRLVNRFRSEGRKS